MIVSAGPGRPESMRVTSGSWAAGTSFRASARPGMFMPGIARAAEPEAPDDTEGTVFGVVTDTLPEPTATEAPVPGTEAVTAGSCIGSGGIGSSMLAEGTSLVASN